MKVEKLDGALRQLDTAILLFFRGGDPVATHSLTASGLNVLSDIADAKEGIESWRVALKDESGLSKTELRSVLNEAWSFFKHADRDPDSCLDFNPEETEDLLFVASLESGEHSTCLLQAFQIWYIAAYPKRFPDNEPRFKDVKGVLKLDGLSKSAKVTEGKKFVETHCLQNGA